MKRIFLSMLILGGIIGASMLHAAVHDPTAPDNAEVQGGDQWELTAIFVSQQKRFAVMHNQFVSVGSEVNGAKVLAIEPNYVELQGQEGRYKVYLIEHTFKQQK